MRLTYLLGIGLGWLLCAGASAQKITVVTEFFPPYQIIDQQQQLSGCATNVVKALFAQTQDIPAFEVLPWSRAYITALRTPNVMIFSIAHNKIRDNKFYWLGNLAEEYLYFWGLKTHFQQPIDSLDKLKKFSIATSKNSNPEQYMQHHGFEHIYPITKIEQGIKMLMRERVDLISGSENSLKQRSEQLGLDFNQLTKVYELKDLNHPLSVAFNINSTAELLATYQKAWNALEQQGTIKQLMAPCINERK